MEPSRRTPTIGDNLEDLCLVLEVGENATRIESLRYSGYARRIRRDKAEASGA